MKKYMGFVLATVSTMVGVVSWLLPDIDFRYINFYNFFDYHMFYFYIME